MVAVVTFPLEHLLAELLILEALGVAVDVDEPPLAVGDEVMILVKDVPQLPQHQLQQLRLQNKMGTFIRIFLIRKCVSVNCIEL